ncbi:hypothetical protein FHS89_000822 [Rubricella aquisinus]|uniref:Yip1 domain-containing protein n=1 Tax=Rubricella aquisinus TaxID=2028108 RepID=A0A840WYS5_9RHOB|nr:Yip1 family protein [Rubricella aquisinus]MBB5514816.1 hypothetical protein [Rubricella aquisinus]
MSDHAPDDFEVTHGHYEDQRASLGKRIIDGWRDMRKSTARLIAEDPAEARLLFYVMLSDIVTFLSWSLKTVVAPPQAAEDRLPVAIAVYLILMLFARTASMYIFAGAIGAVCKLFGGKGSWRDTRAGVFWGALVAAPFGLAMALFTIFLAFMEPTFPALGADWIALPPYWISMVPFLWFISVGVAEAHGFRRVGFLFLSLSILTIAGVFGALILDARGVI